MSILTSTASYIHSCIDYRGDKNLFFNYSSYFDLRFYNINNDNVGNTMYSRGKTEIKLDKRTNELAMVVKDIRAFRDSFEPLLDEV